MYSFLKIVPHGALVLHVCPSQHVCAESPRSGKS